MNYAEIFSVESMMQNLLILTTFVLVALTGYYQWSYRYWKARKLPYLKPKMPFGNFLNPFFDKDGFGIKLKHIYNEIKANGWKHGGTYFFTSPTYVAVDPEYIKNILVKDFQYFSETGKFSDEEHDPLSARLITMNGTRWRKMRHLLISALTTSNIKVLFDNIKKCEYALLRKIEVNCLKKEPINIKDVVTTFIEEFSGLCTFGADYANLKRKYASIKKHSEEYQVPTKTYYFRMLFGLYFSKITKMMGLRLASEELTESYLTGVNEIINNRENNNFTRNDLTQMFLNIKKRINGMITKDFNHEIALLNFIFFMPEGLGNGANRIYFALYELAKNEEIQSKLRNEISTTLNEHNDEITYDSIQSMTYLHQVIKETLRKYPSVACITRKCIKDYKIPDEDIIIERGTVVVMPVLGIHHDEEYYPDPDLFDPERFNAENKALRNQQTYLPFGQGGRSCPGMRLGLLVIKFALVTLLRNYKFTINERSEKELKLKSVSFDLDTDSGIWLNAMKAKCL